MLAQMYWLNNRKSNLYKRNPENFIKQEVIDTEDDVVFYLLDNEGTVIRMSKGRIIIKPQLAPQEKFLSTPADICIYGGAAGGGKTYGLLMEAMRHKNNGDYGAVIFRRNYTQVTAQGGLWIPAEAYIEISVTLYPGRHRNSIGDLQVGQA